MKFDFVTAFPEMIDSYMNQSLMKKALESGVIGYTVLNPRVWSMDRHQSIDDKVCGGGEGMVGKPEPYIRGLSEYKNKYSQVKNRVIHLSPQGAVLNTAKIQELGQYDRICFVCSRYSGLDQRILNTVIDEEISIGDYVVAGGELPALIVAEAVCRFLPGFLGDPNSSKNDSFAIQGLEGPLFTQPRIVQNMEVPEVYLQGHHKKIEEYRYLTGMINTMIKRPDLTCDWRKEDLAAAHRFLNTSRDAELEVLGFLNHKTSLIAAIMKRKAQCE